MRKLLMATAAMLGASLGMANAAQLYTSAPQTGFKMPGFSAGTISPTPLQPGQIVVRIDLRENVYAWGGWDTLNNVNGNKQQPIAIVGYPRLYMGFDALATNGLKYGVFWEIRNVGTTSFGSSSVGSPGTSGNSTGETLFWRRDYGYIGTDQLGTLRLGQTDGPSSLFPVAIFDDFATGLWNGDFPLTLSSPAWPFADVGNYYTSAKAVYLSPNFAGFDFGISYEPSSGNLQDALGCGGPTGLTGCLNQSSSSAASDLQRRRNTIDVGLRYRGAFSGVGIAASITGMFGGHVLPSFNNPGLGAQSASSSTFNGVTTPATSSFQNIAMGYGGLAVTFAGLTVGGSIMGGQYNGQGAALNSGGADSVAWIAGAEYAFGPVIVGGSYFRWKYQGWWTLPTQRTDQGLAFGVTYNIAPGLAFLAEYLYGKRYQGGFNFATGAPGLAFNNVQTQIIGAGLQFRW